MVRRTGLGNGQWDRPQLKNSVYHQWVDDMPALKQAEPFGASPSHESSFPGHLRVYQRATAVTRPEANYIPGAQALPTHPFIHAITLFLKDP